MAAKPIWPDKLWQPNLSGRISYSSQTCPAGLVIDGISYRMTWLDYNYNIIIIFIIDIFTVP